MGRLCFVGRRVCVGQWLKDNVFGVCGGWRVLFRGGPISPEVGHFVPNWHVPVGGGVRGMLFDGAGWWSKKSVLDHHLRVRVEGSEFFSSSPLPRLELSNTKVYEP